MSDMEKHLPDFKQLIALPVLLQLLSFSKATTIVPDRFNVIESRVLDGIYQIGIHSQDNFNETRKQLDDFITRNKASGHWDFLALTIIKMQDQFKLAKIQNYSIDDAIVEWNNITFS